MVSYCNAIWRCRYFWLSLGKLDLRLRYRGSVLGMGGPPLQPIAMTIIFTVVFSRMMGGDPRVYAANVLAGLRLELPGPDDDPGVYDLLPGGRLHPPQPRPAGHLPAA